MIETAQSTPSSPKDERPASVRRWRPPQGYYRAWYTEWEASSVLRELPPSAVAVYRWLWTMSGGQYHVRVPAAVGAWHLGITERTWRRACRALENHPLHLVDVEHGGGAHAACNRFLARAFSVLYTAPPPKDGKPGIPVAYAGSAPAPSPEDLADTPPAPAPERRPLSEATSGEYSSDTPPAPAPAPAPERRPLPEATSGEHSSDTRPPLAERVMPPSLLAQLVDAWVEDTREERDLATSALQDMDGPSRWALAAHYGLVGDEAASPQPVAGLTGRALARELVAGFLRRLGVDRDPWPSEVAQALAMVRKMGAEKAPEAQEQAVKRMLKAVVHWTGRNRPRGYGYLWMHMVALNLVPPLGEEDPPPPDA